MKKMTFFILFISLFLCSCGKKESQENPVFPGLTYEMNMQETLDALLLEKSDIDYVFLDRVGSMFYMEDYALFGAKTKNIDFQFIDYTAVQEYDLTKEMEGQELFYQKLYDITNQLLHLTDNHVLSSIIANYPPDTDMEQVLAEMKKIYGDTSPEMIAYELRLGSFPPPEYKDSEEIKIWAGDVIGSFIPQKDSDAYLKKWKLFMQELNEEEWASWDTFTQNARMQWVLWQNDKDQKRVMFFGSHAGIYRTLHEQISSLNKE